VFPLSHCEEINIQLIMVHGWGYATQAIRLIILRIAS
jgi:hypothetical protein